MRIVVAQSLAARGAGHRRLGSDHCPTIPGPTTAALTGRIEGEVYLLERVRTTLHAGPSAAAARVPTQTRSTTAPPGCSTITTVSLPVLGNTNVSTKYLAVRPVHLRRLKLSARHTASITFRQVAPRMLARNADAAQDEHAEENTPSDGSGLESLPNAPSVHVRPRCNRVFDDGHKANHHEISRQRESHKSQHKVAVQMDLVDGVCQVGVDKERAHWVATSFWPRGAIGRSRSHCAH